MSRKWLSMRSHLSYERLCAKGAYGGASDAEFAELVEHLQGCAECRRLFSKLIRVIAGVLPQLAGAYRRSENEATVKPPSRRLIGLAADIVASRHQRVRWAAVVVATISVLLLGILFTSHYRAQKSDGQHSISAVRLGAPDGKKTEGSPEPKSETRSPVPDNRVLKGPSPSLEAQLAAVSEKLKQQQRDLDSAKREKADLNSRIALLETSNGEALNIQVQRNAEIARLQQELERVRSDEVADRTSSLVSEAELRTLREKVAKQEAQLAELRQLNAAGHSARDLITARSLHVQDILGWDENGKPLPEFGRVFYAEGQKMEFYAYDLGKPNRPSTKVAFYVWAETPGTAKAKSPPVVRLGKFTLDSAKDNRWALIVTDARLLNHLSSIFVTAESSENTVNEPTGKKILSGSLNRKANHP
jgi:hypothetical protein